MPVKHPRNGRHRPAPLLRSLLTFFSFLSHVTSATPAASIASSIDFRYFVAGGSCAAISHGITCPIDVVKTRMQSNPEKYKSLLPATATIIREEGAATLVKGLGPTLVGYGIEGALKFGVYEIAKPMVVVAFMKLNASGEAGMFPFLIASILAGAVASLILVPMESTRIRMVTDPKFEGVGLLGGLSKLVEEAGVAQTLSMGLGAMLAKQVRIGCQKKLMGSFII
jgi:solute carrier family 25 phosphate transporter 3